MSSPVTREGTDAADPRQFFRVLWRRKMILLLCITVLPATAYLYSTRLAKTYEASALISVQGTAVDTGLPVIGDFTSPGATNDAHVAALIETNAVADEAARQLGEPRGSLRGSVTATANEDTKFITITATAGSGERAAAIANTFASALRATRERRGVERVQASIAAVEKSLAKLPPEQRLQRAQLSESLQGLRTLQGAQAQNLQLMQSAAVPSDPVSPNPGRNAVLALVVALLIGAGAVVLVERLDRRLHDPLELEPLTGTPLLARVPESAFPGSAPDPQLPVAFQMLRDSLTYFNLDRPLTSLLVMSALKGDGKTSVITHLAAAYAQAGKRVVLVDADLRSPQVAGRMGVASAPGLSEVLTGGCVLEEALQEVGSFGGHLRVLAGGSIPPNPSEMLGSARMSTVLAQLSELCDLVLIDSAPLLVVSDAFPLLDQVVGIVGVAALERTDRDPIVRAIEVTEKAGGRVLGMVATGGRSHETYGYAYAHPYGGSGDREPAASPDPVVALANGNRQRSDTSGTGRVRRRFRAR